MIVKKMLIFTILSIAAYDLTHAQMVFAFSACNKTQTIFAGVKNTVFIHYVSEDITYADYPDLIIDSLQGSIEPAPDLGWGFYYITPLADFEGDLAVGVANNDYRYSPVFFEVKKISYSYFSTLAGTNNREMSKDEIICNPYVGVVQIADQYIEGYHVPADTNTVKIISFQLIIAEEGKDVMLYTVSGNKIPEGVIKLIKNMQDTAIICVDEVRIKKNDKTFRVNPIAVKLQM